MCPISEGIFSPNMKLGKAFSDNVTSFRGRRTRDINEESRTWWLGTGRVLMFLTVFCLVFFVLVWRLFDLTVVRGRLYRRLADGNRTRELVRHAPRGLFLDRTGKPLARNIPYYRLIKPCTGEDAQGCTTTLTEEEGLRRQKEGLPAGSFLEVDYRRDYAYPAAMAHVIGYTGEITEDELTDEYYTLRQYRPGDRVGRTGAEVAFEDRLRGRNGRELVEVDAAGKIIRTLGRDKEIAGEDVTLAIDAGLQKAAAESFPTGAKGAVIVTKPDTGEILVLYSSPSYDINTVSDGLSQQAYEVLLSNPDKPMFDRAIGGVYPPGSTFKIVTAMAALEEGAIDPKTTVEDTGVLTIGPYSFPNWYFLQYGKKEGMVDLVRALKRSNDIFFYKTGEWLGITKLVVWAQKLGLGKPLGIELGGEAGGLMPDPAWKKKHFSSKEDREARNDEWYVGDTYHVSIGQGYLLTTPLQVNTWTNVVATGGALCTPMIEKNTGDAKKASSHCRSIGLAKETIEVVTRGLVEACATGGTGWPLFNFTVSKADESGAAEYNETGVTPVEKIRIPVACKTGTAEFGDPKNHTHAWFTAYAPVPDSYKDDAVAGDTAKSTSVLTGQPEISVTVLVESAGEGSSVAAPIAKKILESWFGR